MPVAIDAAELGMLRDLQLMDLASQNLANISTMGFKRDLRTGGDFPEILSSTLRQAEAAAEPRSAGIDFSQGALRRTGNSLDLAIEGDGFFELSGPGGPLYTRHGAFGRDASGQLTANGGFVVSGAAGEIMLHDQEVMIDAEGAVWERGVVVGQLKLVRFPDPAALQKVGSTTFALTEAGSSETDTASRLRQGFLEASNVDALDEMVRMLTTLRHFEATQKIVKGYDDMMDVAITTIPEL